MNSDVTLTVSANDSSGLHSTAYSFDGGSTWQESNTYKFKTNQTIETNKIQVKDNAENISKYNKKIITVSIINGDLNQDKKINVTDLLLLKKYLIAGNNNSWKLQDKALLAADINNDAKVNVADLILLKRMLLKK